MRFEVRARQIQRRVPETQRPRLVSQELNPATRRLALRVGLALRIALVIAHAPEYAGIGLDPRQLSNAGVQRIVAPADQVARNDCQIRPQFKRGVDRASELSLA